MQNPKDTVTVSLKKHLTNICHCQGSRIQVVVNVQNAKKNVKYFKIQGNVEYVWQILLKAEITNVLEILPELSQKSGKIFPKWQLSEGKEINKSSII